MCVNMCLCSVQMIIIIIIIDENECPFTSRIFLFFSSFALFRFDQTHPCSVLHNTTNMSMLEHKMEIFTTYFLHGTFLYIFLMSSQHVRKTKFYFRPFVWSMACKNSKFRKHMFFVLVFACDAFSGVILFFFCFIFFSGSIGIRFHIWLGTNKCCERTTNRNVFSGQIFFFLWTVNWWIRTFEPIETETVETENVYSMFS